MNVKHAKEDIIFVFGSLEYIIYIYCLFYN